MTTPLIGFLVGLKRHRHLKLPAPVLACSFPSTAIWDWEHDDPANWKVYQSEAGVSGGEFAVTDTIAGSDRSYAPGNGDLPLFIVGVDADGVEVTQRALAVRPSSAPFPAPAAVAVWEMGVEWTWDVYPDPDHWAIIQADEDGDWVVVETAVGSARAFEPLDEGGLTRVVGCDAEGLWITEPSEAVEPDLVPQPVALLDDLADYWSFDNYDTGTAVVYSDKNPTHVLSTLSLGMETGGWLGAWYKADDYGALTGSDAVPSSGDWTVMLWSMCPTVPATDSVFSVLNVLDIWVQNVSGSGRWGVNLYDGMLGAVATIPGTSLFATLAWNMVVVRKSGFTLELWVNGSLEGSYDLTELTLNEGAGVPVVAADARGRFDEVGFWGRALIDDELTALWNGGFGAAYGTFTAS